MLIVVIQRKHHISTIKWPKERHLKVCGIRAAHKIGLALGFFPFVIAGIKAAVNNLYSPIITQAVMGRYLFKPPLKTMIQPGNFINFARETLSFQDGKG